MQDLEQREDALVDLGSVEAETKGADGVIDDFAGGYLPRTGLNDE